jgi:hypothetical protein
VRKLSFIHIPKTGGSYARQIMKGANFHDTGMHGFSGANPVFDKRINDYTKIHPNRDLLRIKNSKKYDFFTTVRNPFDMLYSYYSHSRNNYSGWAACNTIHDIHDFEDFINKYCDENFEWHYPAFKKMLFSQIFIPSGKCLPKHIIRYEKLNHGLRDLCHMYGIEYNENIVGKLNVSNKKNTYNEAYTDEMIDKVNIKCKFELDSFGYDFNGPTDDAIKVSTRGLIYKWGKYGL